MENELCRRMVNFEAEDIFKALNKLTNSQQEQPQYMREFCFGGNIISTSEEKYLRTGSLNIGTIPPVFIFRFCVICFFCFSNACVL